jgi:hypothetical protein
MGSSLQASKKRAEFERNFAKRGEIGARLSTASSVFPRLASALKRP